MPESKRFLEGFPPSYLTQSPSVFKFKPRSFRQDIPLLSGTGVGPLNLLLAILESILVRTVFLAEPPVITLFVSNQPKPLELLRLMLSRPRTSAAIIKLGGMGVGPAAEAGKRTIFQHLERLGQPVEITFAQHFIKL